MSEKKELIKTILIIALVLVVMIFILFSAGVMDKTGDKIRSRAEFVCWDNGYFGGVDHFQHYGRAYVFTCKTDDLNLTFRPETNWGVFIK